MVSTWDLGSGRPDCDLYQSRGPYDTGRRSPVTLPGSPQLSCPAGGLRFACTRLVLDDGDGPRTHRCSTWDRTRVQGAGRGARCLPESLLSSFMGRDAG